MDLFSRAVETFTRGGNCLTTSVLHTVLKSLIGVKRLSVCGEILKAMGKGGYVLSIEVYNDIIFLLGSVGRREAVEMMNQMEASGHHPDSKTWTSLIRGQCVAGNVKEAMYSFRRMIDKFGVTDAGCAFQEVVEEHWNGRRPTDVYKFLCEMVSQKHFRPLHLTYKMLIGNLLLHGSFNEAFVLLALMKGHDFQPFIDPFIDHISKSWTGADAMSFLNAITVRKFLSTSVVKRMIKAFLKADRHTEAESYFSMCPSHICNQAVVVSLFGACKPVGADATPVAA